MATPRTTPAKGSSSAKVSARRKPTSARNAVKKATPATRRATAKRRKATPKGAAPKRLREDPLPSWKDLDKPTNERIQGRPQEVGFLATVSTTRFAVLILAIAAAFTLYVGHVHGMQDLLVDLQSVRQDNMRLHLEYNRLKGNFDRATGPSLIQERARALGFVERQTYGATIKMD
jgi:hypothetical protein